MVLCLTCGGSGARINGMICQACGGRGETDYTDQTFGQHSSYEYEGTGSFGSGNSFDPKHYERCPTCSGVLPQMNYCPTCRARGIIAREVVSHTAPDRSSFFEQQRQHLMKRFKEAIAPRTPVETKVSCPICYGRTSIEVNGKEMPCSVCNGSGLVTNDKYILLWKTLAILEPAIESKLKTNPKKKVALKKKALPKKALPKKSLPKKKTIKEIIKERAKNKKW